MPRVLVLLLLSACAYVSDEHLADRKDVDNDGTTLDQDCDDTDASIGPQAAEIWYDGIDQNCDGASDYDQDGDGYESAYDADAQGVYGDDCLDGSPLDASNPAGLDPAEAHPDAEETWYDGTDQDCAGGDDYDRDEDGHQAAGHGVGSDDDCDDTLAEVHPDATELCATDEDDDCDGDSNDPGATGCTDYFKDQDGDGEGDLTSTCLCTAGAVYSATNDTDCDDLDDAVYSGADEVTGDGVDQNCDGAEICYGDYDGDGYRTDDTRVSPDADCDDALEASASAPNNDCEDADDDIHPDATEITGDEVDQDCDGEELCYTDDDEDAFRSDDTVVSADEDCGDGTEATSSLTSGDCDDSAAEVYPGASEVKGDSIDENCDGVETCYVDADDDGYRKSSGTVASTDTDCLDAGEGTSTDTSGDCDDTDDTINPGATEIPGDAVDEDCDGDELCYTDADGDGYRGSATVVSSDTDCRDSGEAPLTTTDGDCDDDDGNTYPGASETCEDDVVNDCDGTEADALAACVWSASYSADDAYARRYSTGTTSNLGYSVAFVPDADGDDEGLAEIAVGAERQSSARGVVTLYVGTLESGVTSATSAYSLRVSGEYTSDYLGRSVAGLNDADGDGLGDLLMGAPYNDSGGSSAGAAYIYSGTTSGGYTAPDGATELVGDIGDQAGERVASIGDQDRDGLDELLVSAPGYAVGTDTDVGAVYLVYGAEATGTLSAIADSVITGSTTSDELGRALSSGDVNGDGVTDLLLGCSLCQGSGASIDDDAGVASLILDTPGAEASAADVADLLFMGVATGDEAGSGVAANGDVDGDGYDDVLVGARYESTYGSNAGAAYLAFGGVALSGTLSLSSATATFYGETESDDAGWSVALGDLTGDSDTEVLIGALNASATGYTDAGAVYMLFGGRLSGTLDLSIADVAILGEEAGDDFGYSLAAGADANGDGYGDLLVGAPFNDHTVTSGGMLYYFTGTGF